MPRAALTPDAIRDFRERLCAAATRRFAERGFEGVTLRALAGELGVSPMTPYRYFRDKEEIFAAVRAAAFERFAERQDAAASARGPLARLRALGRAYVAFAEAEPHAYRIMFEMALELGRDHPELRAAQERAWLPLRRATERAVRAGKLRGPAEARARLLWAGLHGVVSLHLLGALASERGLAALAEPMVETLIEGDRSAVRPRLREART